MHDNDTTDDWVALCELAREWGIKPGHEGRWGVLRQLGIIPQRVFTRVSEHQQRWVLCVSGSDAKRLRDLRLERFPRLTARVAARSQPSPNGAVTVGVFYIVQLVPDLKPTRVKLGFALDLLTRMDTHLQSAPTAVPLAQWPSRPIWEIPAIECITRTGYTQLGRESFDCEDLDALVGRAQAFFDLMPSLS